MYSRRFPAEREQFSGPRNEGAADALPDCALANSSESQFKPSFRYRYEPRWLAQASTVTCNDVVNGKWRRIRYYERFSVRARVGEDRSDSGIEILDRQHGSLGRQRSERQWNRQARDLVDRPKISLGPIAVNHDGT